MALTHHLTACRRGNPPGTVTRGVFYVVKNVTVPNGLICLSLHYKTTHLRTQLTLIHHSQSSYTNMFRMGGGKMEKYCSSSSGEISSSNNKINSINNYCLMCEKGMHEAIDCAWIYSRCKMVRCNGLRKLLKAQTDDHPCEKFFSCSICPYFEWFADATTPGKQCKFSFHLHFPALLVVTKAMEKATVHGQINPTRRRNVRAQ